MQGCAQCRPWDPGDLRLADCVTSNPAAATMKSLRVLLEALLDGACAELRFLLIAPFVESQADYLGVLMFYAGLLMLL